jgi:hypothetical protein
MGVRGNGGMGSGQLNRQPRGWLLRARGSAHPGADAFHSYEMRVRAGHVAAVQARVVRRGGEAASVLHHKGHPDGDQGADGREDQVGEVLPEGVRALVGDGGGAPTGTIHLGRSVHSCDGEVVCSGESRVSAWGGGVWHLGIPPEPAMLTPPL